MRVVSLFDGAPRWPSGAAEDDGTVYAETALAGDLQQAVRSVDRNRCQIEDHRCYVLIGTPNSSRRPETVSVAPTRVVCLDLAAEGRVVWSVGSDENAGGSFVTADHGPLKSLAVSHAPLFNQYHCRVARSTNTSQFVFTTTFSVELPAGASTGSPSNTRRLAGRAL